MTSTSHRRHTRRALTRCDNLTADDVPAPTCIQQW